MALLNPSHWGLLTKPQWAFRPKTVLRVLKKCKWLKSYYYNFNYHLSINGILISCFLLELFGLVYIVCIENYNKRGHK